MFGLIEIYHSFPQTFPDYSSRDLIVHPNFIIMTIFIQFLQYIIKLIQYHLHHLHNFLVFSLSIVLYSYHFFIQSLIFIMFPVFIFISGFWFVCLCYLIMPSIWTRDFCVKGLVSWMGLTSLFVIGDSTLTSIFMAILCFIVLLYLQHFSSWDLSFNY